MDTTHNLTLSDEQEMILDQVAKLVQDKIAPVALERDEHRQFVRDSFDQLAEMGMLGLPIDEDQGGAGFGMLGFVVALEEIAKACGSSARLLLVQAGLCGKALEGIAPAAETLQALAMGEKLAAFVGSHCGVVARADGDGHVLSGEAPLVTAATEADTLVVAAIDADGKPLLFCCDAGVAEREAIPALGFRAAAPGRVRFVDARVPAAALVAAGDDAAAAVGRARLAACIGGGALGVGFALASCDGARRHTHERIAFGKPLYAQQAVSLKLVDSLRRASAARHSVYHAARLVDAGQDAAREAAFARLDAIEAAVLAADEAIQVHGGYGYVVEYHVERHYRDAKTLEVLDGGAEALRDGVAASLALG